MAADATVCELQPARRFLHTIARTDFTSAFVERCTSRSVGNDDRGLLPISTLLSQASRAGHPLASALAGGGIPASHNSLCL